MSAIKLTCDGCFQNSITIKTRQVHQARRKAKGAGWRTRLSKYDKRITDDLCQLCVA